MLAKKFLVRRFHSIAALRTDLLARICFTAHIASRTISYEAQLEIERQRTLRWRNRKLIAESIQEEGQSSGAVLSSTTESDALALNQQKRLHKSCKDPAQQQRLESAAKEKLKTMQIDMLEPNEKAVVLILNAAVYFHASPLNTPVIQQCVDWLKENVAGCEAQHVALFAHAVSLLRLDDCCVTLCNLIAPRMDAVLPSTLPVEMAMVLQAFARTSDIFKKQTAAFPSMLIHKILLRVVEVRGHVRAAEMSTILTAAVILQPLLDPRVVAPFADKVSERVCETFLHAEDSIRSDDFLLICNTLSRLPVIKNSEECHRLCHAIAVRGASLARHFSSADLGVFLRTLVRLEGRDQDVQHQPSSAYFGEPQFVLPLQSRIDTVGAYFYLEDLAAIARACRCLGVELLTRSFLQQAAKVLCRVLRRSEVSLEELANALFEISRLGTNLAGVARIPYQAAAKRVAATLQSEKAAHGNTVTFDSTCRAATKVRDACQIVNETGVEVEELKRLCQSFAKNESPKSVLSRGQELSQSAKTP